MARKVATREKRTERAVVIGVGITEKWYFSHLQSLYNLKIKIRPRFFGNENIPTLEKLISQVLNDGGLAIVVFDADVSTWNDVEKQRLQKLRQTYGRNKRVILCDSMPSIEFWFLIHFINTGKFFGTSKSVITELVKYIPQFEKSEQFLASRKWVEELCRDGKPEKAYNRAKNMGTEDGSYSNFWKAADYLGIFSTDGQTAGRQEAHRLGFP